MANLTTLTSGSSVTLTVMDQQTIVLNNGLSDKARLQIATGPGAGSVVADNHRGRRVYGPFGAGTVTLSAISGDVSYELSGDAVSPLDDDGQPLTKTENQNFRALVSGAGDWERNGRLQQWSPLASKLEDFSSFSDWTISSTTANSTVSAAAAGTNYPYRGGLRFTSNGGDSASPAAFKTLAVNGTNDGLDLTAYPGFWMVTDVLDPGPGGKSLNINLALFESAAGFGAGFQCTAIGPALSVGVQARWLPRSLFTSTGGGVMTNRMKSLRVRHDAGAGTSRDVVLCGMFTQGHRPQVIVSFDDGWIESFSIGFAEAQQRGIPLTHYLIPELFGSTNYITAANAATMRAAGDYLGLHGAVRWDTNTALVAADIAKCQAAGIDIQHAAIPEGQYGNIAQRAAMRAAFVAGGVKTARITAGNGATHFAPMLHGVGDPYSLNAFGPNNTNASALAEAKQAVDYAIQSGGTVIFYLHRIGATSDLLYWNQSEYEQLLDYIYMRRSQGEIDTTTIDRWYSGGPTAPNRSHLDIRQAVRTPVAASRSLTLGDDGCTLLCTGAVTLTVPQDLNLVRGVRVQCPASGTVTIAVGGSVTINGAATSLTRTRASNFAGFDIVPTGDPNVYGVSGA